MRCAARCTRRLDRRWSSSTPTDSTQSTYYLGRFAESVDLILDQAERLEQLQEPVLTGQCYFWLGHIQARLGEHEAAIQSAQRAIAEAGRCGDDATAGKAYGVLAFQ